MSPSIPFRAHAGEQFALGQRRCREGERASLGIQGLYQRLESILLSFTECALKPGGHVSVLTWFAMKLRKHGSRNHGSRDS